VKVDVLLFWLKKLLAKKNGSKISDYTKAEKKVTAFYRTNWL
jgi:hypothetical protein